MKELVVYYSKTGTTKKVADAVISGKECDFDELRYDEKAKTVSQAHDPSEYERVILLAPVWAFSLAEPMKLYLAKNKSKIKRYNLVVTCGAFGLRGCVNNCKKAIGRPPENALVFKAKNVKQGDFDISLL